MPHDAPARPDAFTMTPTEWQAHLQKLGCGAEAHDAKLYSHLRPAPGWSQPAVSRAPAPAQRTKPVVDARTMTSAQWEQHLARLNAGDIANERFVGEEARDLAEGREPSTEPPTFDARTAPTEQLRERIETVAPDLANEIFGAPALRARPVPSNAEIDQALVDELARLRRVAGVSGDVYHVDAADPVLRSVSQRLGIDASAVGQSAQRLQMKGRLTIDRSGGRGVERWGIAPKRR